MDCPKPSSELTTPEDPPTLFEDWYDYSTAWVRWYGRDLVRQAKLNQWNDEHKCYAVEQ